MVEVRNYVDDDTEVIALMPNLNSAVEWMRSQLDLDLPLKGDYYAVDETGLRTYLMIHGGHSTTAEESRLINSLVKYGCALGWATPLRLRDEFGWGKDHEQR